LPELGAEVNRIGAGHGVVMRNARNQDGWRAGIVSDLAPKPSDGPTCVG
jgi:hypothetical protein